MKQICWHYDLLYYGGIEQSLSSLLEMINSNKMVVTHRKQYFTQQSVVDRIAKQCEIINTDEIEQINPEICIFAGLIFDYETIFQKIKAKKYIGWVHFIPTEQAIFENMLLYPEYYNKIDMWVCVSETAKRGLLKLIPNANVRVIHNVIDENRVKQMSQIPININAPKNAIKFVTSSRLSEEKGIYEGIELCKRFEEAKIPYVWYLIGGGIDTDVINAINDAKQKYNIITPGYLQNPYNIIKQCDYGLLLSKNESWSIFVDECHILGIPTITTNFDAIYERENIEKYGIIINEDLSNLDINKIIEKKDILKNNLKSYKYQNDLHLWNEIFEEIKK